ncbi:unnamed protein product [Oikopleura dioica]|uniref:CUE domain-containing protein n=1 Tax=Oikopleura dioica TaxID=34765 RepID=E4WSJ0_OIKDI|nr:unnamed protein product [Oikopleura dioica]CBY38223.1 unnamed protein product [Oikopleura dioica]
MDRVPRVYNDAVLAKLDVLADELERFSTAGPVAFWSSVVHNKSCQKCLVSCAENLPRLYEMKFIVDEYRNAIKALSKNLRNIFMRIISQKEIEDSVNLDLSSLLDLYTTSDLASCFGHIPSFKKGLKLLLSRSANETLTTKLFDYEIMASSALNEVIERFDVVDKLNNKGLVDLYSSGLDIISSFLSLSSADPRIAEQLAEPFDDPESKQEVYLLQKVAVLFELISEYVSNKVPEIFYLQVYSLLYSLQLTETVIKIRFQKEKMSEEDAEIFLLLSHALLNNKVFLLDLQDHISLLDVMLKMKNSFPKIVKEEHLKWFLEDAKAQSPSVKLSQEGIQIREIYPDLGSDFINKLLSYYKNNVQEVMIALLEDNLPPQLASLDRTAEVKVEPQKPKLIIPGLYHKKAKTKRRDEKKEEEERQYIRKIAMNYQYTENVEIVEVAEDETGAKYSTSKEYGDEYDDTYDDVTEYGAKVEYDVVKPADLAIDSDLQLNSNHQNLIKRKAKGNPRVQEESDSNSSNSRPQSRSDRVSAPVSASSYYKQVWQEKHKNEKEPGGPPPPRRNLTEDATDLQKRRKDVNKARVGNHNRKKMAMKKQSRGMTGPE